MPRAERLTVLCDQSRSGHSLPLNTKHKSQRPPTAETLTLWCPINETDKVSQLQYITSTIIAQHIVILTCSEMEDMTFTHSYIDSLHLVPVTDCSNPSQTPANEAQNSQGSSESRCQPCDRFEQRPLGQVLPVATGIEWLVTEIGSASWWLATAGYCWLLLPIRHDASRGCVKSRMAEA
jgi:hypothetical protein